MWGVVLILLWLAVYKGFEPLLLIPIAFGALLANLPTENLIEKPAGPVRSPATGSIVASMVQPGEVVTIERVPHERPDHLIRLKPDEIEALFQAESARYQAGEGALLFVIRPETPTPTDDSNPAATSTPVRVPFAGGQIEVTRDDFLVWSPSSGRVVDAPAPLGTTVIEGQTLTELSSHHTGGFFHWISLGVVLEIFPPIIFLGVGALTDFGPLIANPRMLLLGAAAQLGVFVTFLGAIALGFTAKQAASIGIIGGADGPTSIFLSNALAPELMAPIAVAAYSYMALVPVIQPPIMRALTNEAERKIRMKSLRKVSRLEKLIFALAVTVLCILLVPPVAPLIAMLMLGNFLRECGVTERLTKAAQNEIINIITIFLGTSVGITMQGDRFLRLETMMIIVLGVIAFGFSTAGGVLMAKLMNVFSKNKINPLIGSAGVSAVPMAARVSHTEGLKADPHNYLLMHAMGPNVAGVIGTALAAGYFLALLGGH
ncbi:sodium ion-translocating decarboxylase subunit beta [Haloferula luteola]